MKEEDDIWETLLAADDKRSRVKSVIFENSSILKEARYDDLMKALTVSFKNSPGVYSYFDVPPDVANTLLGSAGDGSSAGKYFIKHIKNLYPFKRIS